MRKLLKPSLQLVQLTEKQIAKNKAILGNDSPELSKEQLKQMYEYDLEKQSYLESIEKSSQELLNIKNKIQKQKEIENKIPIQNTIWTVKLYDEKPYSEPEKLAIINYSKYFDFVNDKHRKILVKTIQEQIIELENWYKSIGYEGNLLQEIVKIHSKNLQPIPYNFEILLSKITTDTGSKLDKYSLTREIKSCKNIARTGNKKNSKLQKVLSKAVKLSTDKITGENSFEKNLWTIEFITSIDELETGFYLSDRTSNVVLDRITDDTYKYWLDKKYCRKDLKKAQQAEYNKTMDWDFTKIFWGIASKEPNPAEAYNIKLLEQDKEIIDLKHKISIAKKQYTKTKASSYKVSIVKNELKLHKLIYKKYR